MDLSNLVCLVVGASSGIGKVLCRFLHEKNAIVIGTYFHNKINDKFVDEYYCDLTNEEEIKKLFAYINKNYKNLFAVVNCSALSLDGDIYEKTKKEFLRVLDVNLVAPFLVCREASKIMKKGVIVNISSTDATDTFNVYSMDYSSSKAGLENLTKNLAKRFQNLKICALAPNWVDTESVLEMNQDFLKKELKRVGQNKLLKKEDVALKIIEIMTNDNIKSGTIIRMEGKNE